MSGARRIAVESASVVLGLVLLFWTLLPIYNMILIAINTNGHDEFSGLLWPAHPTLRNFTDLWTGANEDIRDVGRQFANSIAIGAASMVATVFVASLASFAVGRMRLGRDWMLGATALAIYAVPASTLVIPFIVIMKDYGLADSPLAVIAAETTFATPYAVLVLHYFARLLPIELDEAARIDGASAPQVYRYIYLPLMAPALAAVATYALLFAWNDYFYQYMLLASERHTTIAVALEQFFDDDDAPWNYMMAISLLYALPPVATFYALRRFIAAGLTAGAVKG
ncbi:MAG: carbohydrate ABC transporter permease [Rhodospirillales bacterium]|nr:carbohydrate ABC transporter permease [Rhodospirillales bacterium]